MASDRRMIPRDVRKMLDHSGVDWSIERGTKHRKLMIEGVFVCPLSGTEMKARTLKNFRSRIRRHLKRIT